MTKTKLITLGLCVFGIIMVAYGLLRDHDAVFIVGLLLVIAGYILIRGKLKESIRNARPQDRTPSPEP